MNFTRHAFISYTHIDNQVLAGQELGWVTRFHDNVKTMLETRLGEKVDIWRDNKLAGNDKFSDEILAQFPDVALLVSVISPRYLNSDWCKLEAHEFCRIARQGLIVEGSHKFRFFKVIKLPVKQLEGLPPEFNEALNFCFYTTKNDVAIEIDPAYGKEMFGEFNLSVAILAQKMAETVQALRAATHPLKSATEKKGVIFLADTSWDREPERKLLEAELTGRGYRVLPEHSLPTHEDECRAEIIRLLGACELSIHFIGSQPGMVPNGPSQKSVEELENELASQEVTARAIPRVIWIPNSQSKNPLHQLFMDRLTREDSAQLGADVVTGDFESLKTATLAALQKLQDKKSAASRDLSDAKSVNERLIYVICDKRDTQNLDRLRQALIAREYSPRRPLFKGDAATIRHQNDLMLRESKAVIVYYGAGDEGWYLSTIDELKKSKTPAPVWTYLAAPVTWHEQELLEDFAGGQLVDGMSVDPPDSEFDRLVSIAVRGAAGESRR